MTLRELASEPLLQVVYAALVGAAQWLGTWALRKFTRSAAAGYWRVAVPFGLSALALAGYWLLGWPHIAWAAALAVSVVLVFALVELSSFWRAGVQGADVRIEDGLDYAKSLALCHNKLWLLGIGAAKLTSLPEFEPALRRCARHEGGTIRFLLATPGSRFLGSAARLADKADDAYMRRVENSLRTLAQLRVHGGLKFDVRFYPEEEFVPLFRLMFIDDRLCLASYNVFGHGDGRDLPQLRVAQREGRDYASFYDPFRRYFEALWKNAQPWRPEEYLKP